jgi:hypothetical protein
MKLNLNPPLVPAAFFIRYNEAVPAGILKSRAKIQRRAYKIHERRLSLKQFIPYLNLKPLVST